MEVTTLSLGKYEIEGLKLLSERRGYTNGSDLIRQAIRLFLKREGIRTREIEKRIKTQ